MFPATRSTRTKRTRQVLPGAGRGGAGSGVLSLSLYGDETGVGETPPKPAMRALEAMRHPGVALACTEKGSIANGALPFFFSLVLRLKLPQQRPRQKHGQDEPHENAKDDITRGHKRITKTPPNPNKRTTPPIIAATIATFLWSKSSAITTPTHSYSVSKSRTPLPELSGFRQDNP